MIWWFLILACSVGAVLWACAAVYLRVQRHLQADSSTRALAASLPEMPAEAALEISQPHIH
ncbi:MAG: hypothetical protein H0X25_01025 [Acidobacteriales bacterium]|nr:hypothetical protein [Terriglobales bacterium]